MSGFQNTIAKGRRGEASSEGSKKASDDIRVIGTRYLVNSFFVQFIVNFLFITSV